MTEGYQNLRNRRSQHSSPVEPIDAVAEDSPELLPVTQLLSDATKPSDLVTVEESESGAESAKRQGSQTDRPQPTLKHEAHKVHVVAELSANHKQDLDLAFRTLRAMADAGADAVKLQSYDAQSLTLPLQQPPFIIENNAAAPSPWDGRSFYSLYEESAMPWAWHKPLYKLAGQLGLPIFSTPFCLRGVDFLEQIGSPCYKIASFEIGHLELVRRIAATGKPIIASLGIASFSDIEQFLEVCFAEGNSDVTLLQCSSAYPASPVEANLAMLPHLKSTFGCRVGLSDHSLGSAVAVAAVALGAELIEKHFILSRGLGGSDASFSMEPAEFAGMIEEIRIAEAALGQVDYRLTEKKRAARRFGRAIFVLRDLKAGEILQREDVAVLRPFPPRAIEPQKLELLIGARLRCDVSYASALEWHMLELHPEN